MIADRSFAGRLLAPWVRLMTLQHFGSRLSWAQIFGVLFFAYALSYLGLEALPGDPAAPLGWWGWFDQGNYIAAARAFASGQWRSFDHYYPPLYPWLGSWFIQVWPAHPFFLVDFAGLALHVAALVAIGRQLFGGLTVAVSIVAAFALFPSLTWQQWEVPWTTSVSAGLGALLLLVFVRFVLRQWSMTRLRDWIFVGLYGLGFGSIAAVRPLDSLAWLPLSVIFYLGIFYRNANPLRSGFRVLPAVVLAALILATGLLTPAFYIAFNLITSHTVVGAYILRTSVNGYQIHSMLRKFISLFFDSAAVYVESGQAIADRFWPFYLALPLLIYGLLRGPLLLRVVALTILVQFLLYIPYADLLPNGMFRYMNVHYFAWTFPWLIMISLGFIESCWAPGRPRRRPNPWSIVLVCLCALVLFALKLDARPVGSTSATVTAPHTISVELDRPHRIDFIDLVGTSGSWTDIYFGAHALKIDGRLLQRISDFRLLPTQHGLRLVLPLTTSGQHFDLDLDPAIAIDKTSVAARAAGVSVSLLCRIASCDLPDLALPLPVVDESTTISIDNTGRSTPFLTDGWSSPEDWGRWSDARAAYVEFRLGHSRLFRIEMTLVPLLSDRRTTQTVTILANACPVAQVSFARPGDDDVKIVDGPVPEACVPADGHVKLAIISDHVVTPKDIGLGDDERTLGIGLKQLKID